MHFSEGFLFDTYVMVQYVPSSTCCRPFYNHLCGWTVEGVHVPHTGEQILTVFCLHWYIYFYWKQDRYNNVIYVTIFYFAVTQLKELFKEEGKQRGKPNTQNQKPKGNQKRKRAKGVCYLVEVMWNVEALSYLTDKIRRDIIYIVITGRSTLIFSPSLV